ncbi:hypothetical protein Cgig2_029265 [Carnegiea gigantea]|uniref:F-box domain-containing protein n=1 Tax=Carnegiea gigantea TaxID=171969 RepID=A0A9Q1KUQ2_9CARY|nr:hypothetical protein Cgig2_029265 [Carnegiea gigantea]
MTVRAGRKRERSCSVALRPRPMDDTRESDQTLVEVADSQNWLELPRDVTLTILMKLGTFEILRNAQFVCKLWYNLCKDPSMWRVIRMLYLDEPEYEEEDLDEYESVQKHENMLYDAIDRSSGGLVSLDITGFSLIAQIISDIADRECSLWKSLDQTNSNTCEIAFCSSLSAGSLIKALNKLSSLEELELTLCSTSREQNANIIRHCSLLKTFKLNQQASLDPRFAYDGEAVAIADTVHELRHLQLFGNRMTKEGLKAILDNCPHLQSLDLRACFRVDLAGDVGKRCAQQIKNFGHPYDSTDDCDFIVTDYDSHFDETNCDYDFDETSADEYDGMDLSDVVYYEFSDDGTFSSESSSDSMSS